MKIYVSGPMTGLPEYNYPAFREKSAFLREIGHEVYNPSEFPYDGPLEDFPIREAFASYCKFICEEADAIYMLKDWKQSAGARVEHDLAKRLGLKIMYQEWSLNENR